MRGARFFRRVPSRQSSLPSKSRGSSTPHQQQRRQSSLANPRVRALVHYSFWEAIVASPCALRIEQREDRLRCWYRVLSVPYTLIKSSLIIRYFWLRSSSFYCCYYYFIITCTLRNNVNNLKRSRYYAQTNRMYMLGCDSGIRSYNYLQSVNDWQIPVGELYWSERDARMLITTFFVLVCLCVASSSRPFTLSVVSASYSCSSYTDPYYSYIVR